MVETDAILHDDYVGPLLYPQVESGASFLQRRGYKEIEDLGSAFTLKSHNMCSSKAFKDTSNIVARVMTVGGSLCSCCFCCSKILTPFAETDGEF